LEFQGRLQGASYPGEERPDPEHSKRIGILGACAVLSLDLVQCQQKCNVCNRRELTNVFNIV